MYLIYSILLTIGFLLMSPLFLLRREKYASGFKQRLGNYPEFKHDHRKIIWLHCVSVGETNAARPLVDQLLATFPDHRLVISTTTRTGQELAQKIFHEKADAVFFFPFDWKFSVRRALVHFKPSLVLLMETEIWPRFIREAKLSSAKVVIVNGRLSERSFRQYSKVRFFITKVLAAVDLALMQGTNDANRLISLGMSASCTSITGNLKFDHSPNNIDESRTESFRERFGISDARLLVIAASTHDPEERLVIESLDGELGQSFRLMIAPRHPERFNAVASILSGSGYSFVRRSDEPGKIDKTATIILLDSIGELRSAYPLADIVFVGGSLFPHGGQSVFEPALAGKAIVTGPFTTNFQDAIRSMLEKNALIQTSETPDERQISERLYEAFMDLEDAGRRDTLGRKALEVMSSGQGATARTVEFIDRLLDPKLEAENS